MTQSHREFCRQWRSTLELPQLGAKELEYLYLHTPQSQVKGWARGRGAFISRHFQLSHAQEKPILLLRVCSDKEMQVLVAGMKAHLKAVCTKLQKDWREWQSTGSNWWS